MFESCCISLKQITIIRYRSLVANAPYPLCALISVLQSAAPVPVPGDGGSERADLEGRIMALLQETKELKVAST